MGRRLSDAVKAVVAITSVAILLMLCAWFVVEAASHQESEEIELMLENGEFDSIPPGQAP